MFDSGKTLEDSSDVLLFDDKTLMNNYRCDGVDSYFLTTDKI